MTSEKQLLANQQNAQLSTGPKTPNGKAVIAANAIKHGIFTKDLVVSSTFGKESEKEYLEVLNNLIDCLIPQNQMESLLVEKIAIDFWRLRRVIRYEAGSIEQYLEQIFEKFYTFNKKNNEELDKEITGYQEYISWIDLYVKCLEKEKVDFDQPIWAGKNIESDIAEDFLLIIQKIDTLTYQEKEHVLYEQNSYEELKAILNKNGYTDKKKITNRLLELYEKEKHRIDEKISELEKEKLVNIETDKLNIMLTAIPEKENAEKILKYERSLQKSIFQNLLMLKKLQGSI